MLGLVPMLIAILDRATDVLPRCLAIFESYLLLDAQAVLTVRTGSHRFMHRLLT